METKEKNKLIAEFMGVKKSPYNSFDMYQVINCIEDEVDEQHFYTPKEMLFPSSWDWLMPVVTKCFKTGDNTDNWDSLFNALSTCDIKEVYQEVVTFIQETKNEG